MTTRGLSHHVLELPPVALAEGLSDGRHVRGVPVQADESGGQELVTELILLGGCEGVVEEEGVADGAVDDTIEDVGKEFTLLKQSVTLI